MIIKSVSTMYIYFFVLSVLKVTYKLIKIIFTEAPATTMQREVITEKVNRLRLSSMKIMTTATNWLFIFVICT